METLSTPTRVSELATILDDAVASYPDACAIATETDRITYRDLGDRVAALADRLREAGVGPDCTVAVHVPRSPVAIIAIHAVIATGAVVAPLDANDPPERVRTLLDQAGASHLVVHHGDPSTGEEWEQSAESIGETLALVRRDVAPTALEPGYLLFTSGSTGVPKGVLLPGRAVAHFARWAAESIGLTSADRVAAQASLTFDLSTFDLFSTAVAGATTVVFPDWLKPFPADTVDWLAQQQITALYGVPTLIKGIVAAGGRASTLPDLTTVLFAGEPYPVAALADLQTAFPEATIRNWYGPTETNVCTAYDVRQWQPGTPVPIGDAIDAVTVAIVDDELVVAGPTLLTGYVVDGVVSDPAVDVVFPDGETRRAYRTGDHVYRDDGGRLVLVGRVDRQIKRRGYRIDLDGVEAVAAESASVRAAAAVVVGLDQHLVLFVDVDPASTTALESVEHILRERLPAYSQPDRVVPCSPLPTNPRGKVDRPRLEELAAHTLTDRQENQS
ncbi:AMP-binding protein [Gordonia sp. HY002]|uniref:AMP-binding protein n=1 Tax=Gordonia zhenghanii TaxID=2911516 RepID=UPI001EF0AC36|nr:AMP-binding protein [Gordonia zhenghanii]MCF8568821.1 AMP-binding protein [Gordonia zhenghanii]MCF8602309.1 AMP-binding protein [Gordonia zhenghanii]